jgi:unsaturated rhamnogalacturonyl hydrolase
MTRRQFFPFPFVTISGLALAQDTPRPRLVYSRAWNAIGETRYQPDGSYSRILGALGSTCELTVRTTPESPLSLKATDVLLIANPSAAAVGAHPNPQHFSADDIAALTEYVEAGGGLILFGNQEAHNLETTATNRLLARFGLKWEDRYTDIKRFPLAPDVPIIGGLVWSFYSGNALVLDPAHAAKPIALVTNDVQVPPFHGPRNAAAVLMATATLGKGRVVVATDAGWISNAVLDGQGINGVVVPNADNLVIMQRLVAWAGQRTS